MLAIYMHNDAEHPIAVALRSAVDEEANLLLLATDTELTAARNQLPHYYRERVASDLLVKRDTGALRELALGLVLQQVDLSNRDLRTFLKPTYLKQSCVYDLYPELRDYHDEDGLLRLDAPGIRFTPDGVFYRGHILWCHQFLRRYFTANPNFDFLRVLAEYRQAHPENVCRLAIDHTRILAVIDRPYMYHR